jgi:hypothetical protein
MTSVRVDVILQSTAFNNKNPKIRISNNDILLGDVECFNELETLSFNAVPSINNLLKIELYNKSFGDNRIWDCGPDNELKIKIIDIKFDDVSIGHLITSLQFTTNWTPQQVEVQSSDFINRYSNFVSDGIMVFNGFLEFAWSMPVYDFLIERKFKESYNPSVSYYSNKTELFHYEHGQEFLYQIKQLIRVNES